VAVGVLSESLTVDVGDDTAHHVVTGGHHWNRLFYRIRVSEGTRQLKNARQFLIQGLFAQVVKLEEYVIAFGTAAAPLKNFQDHGAGDHIATSQIFGVGCIALHKALAVFVDQIPAFTAAAFRHQHPGAGNAGRVKLPHFNILNRKSGPDRHTNSITGIDVSVGSGSIDTTGTTGSKYCRLGADIDGLPVVHIDGNNTDYRAVLVFDEIGKRRVGRERRQLYDTG